jgi:hypothetical protein
MTTPTNFHATLPFTDEEQFRSTLEAFTSSLAAPGDYATYTFSIPNKDIDLLTIDQRTLHTYMLRVLTDLSRFVATLRASHPQWAFGLYEESPDQAFFRGRSGLYCTVLATRLPPPAGGSAPDGT